MNLYELKETHAKQLGILTHYGNYHRFVIRGIRLTTLNNMCFPGKPILASEHRHNGKWIVQFFMKVSE